jgi:hypothetical protein
MKLFTSKDFFDQLNTDSIKPLITISGFVKKSEDKTKLYFSLQNDGINWIKIPSLMIDSVKILSYNYDEFSLSEKQIMATLYLNEPTNKEAKILFELINIEKNNSKYHCENFSMHKKVACECSKNCYCSSRIFNSTIKPIKICNCG